MSLRQRKFQEQLDFNGDILEDAQNVENCQQFIAENGLTTWQQQRGDDKDGQSCHDDSYDESDCDPDYNEGQGIQKNKRQGSLSLLVLDYDHSSLFCAVAATKTRRQRKNPGLF